MVIYPIVPATSTVVIIPSDLYDTICILKFQVSTINELIIYINNQCKTIVGINEYIKILIFSKINIFDKSFFFLLMIRRFPYFYGLLTPNEK